MAQDPYPNPNDVTGRALLSTVQIPHTLKKVIDFLEKYRAHSLSAWLSSFSCRSFQDLDECGEYGFLFLNSRLTSPPSVSEKSHHVWDSVMPTLYTSLFVLLLQSPSVGNIHWLSMGEAAKNLEEAVVAELKYKIPPSRYNLRTTFSQCAHPSRQWVNEYGCQVMYELGVWCRLADDHLVMACKTSTLVASEQTATQVNTPLVPIEESESEEDEVPIPQVGAASDVEGLDVSWDEI